MQEKKLTPFKNNASIVFLELGGNIINEEVLRRIGLTTMYTTLSQSRLGHVLRMNEEGIPCYTVSWLLANGMLVVTKTFANAT